MTSRSPPIVPDPQALAASIVKLRAVVPEDAFTAGVLGCERIGSGVVIDAAGLILTIGYLIAEASDVWLTTHQGRQVAGHPLAYDQVTGFGLVLPLENLALAPLALGSSNSLSAGAEACVLSYPEFAHPLAVRILARREFAGAWEYLLEDAIFTVPAHSHWSGAALIEPSGALAGLGSLLVREVLDGEETNVNMFVPIDALTPILEDLKSRGAARRPTRPWLGVYGAELSGRVYVTGIAEGGPAQLARVRVGDLISHVADQEVSTLAQFYRSLWALGPAGTEVPLRLVRSGTRLRVAVHSVDRADLLKRPVGH